MRAIGRGYHAPNFAPTELSRLQPCDTFSLPLKRVTAREPPTGNDRDPNTHRTHANSHSGTDREHRPSSRQDRTRARLRAHRARAPAAARRPALACACLLPSSPHLADACLGRPAACADRHRSRWPAQAGPSARQPPLPRFAASRRKNYRRARASQRQHACARGRHHRRARRQPAADAPSAQARSVSPRPCARDPRFLSRPPRRSAPGQHFSALPLGPQAGRALGRGRGRADDPRPFPPWRRAATAPAST